MKTTSDKRREKKCCRYHDKMFIDKIECGLAGRGEPIVCCKKCPDNIYGKNVILYSKVKNDPDYV